MAIFVIPNPDKEPNKVIPKTSADKKPGQYAFTSLTDHFNPKDTYTKPLIQQATHDANLLDEHIERLSRLIEARGVYVHFVKRLSAQDGEYCSCFDPISRTPMRKYCLECYGTRIKGGYQLYKNKDREDGKIIIAAPFTDALVKWEDYGRDLQEENTYWTGPHIPLSPIGSTVFSYDFIVMYNEDGTELGRYYIVSVKPSRAIQNRVTYQTFRVRLADKPIYDSQGNLVRRGDILYEIDLNKLKKVEGPAF